MSELKCQDKLIKAFRYKKKEQSPWAQLSFKVSYMSACAELAKKWREKKMTQIRIQLQKSFWYVISICMKWTTCHPIFHKASYLSLSEEVWMLWGMVNPKKFEKKAQSIKSTYHWILVMFSLNPRIPQVSFVSKTCWLLRYIQLNFKYPYSITVSWELRDSLHAYAILFAYTWCNIVTCPGLKEIVFAQPRGQTGSRYLSVTGLHTPFNIKITVMQTKVHYLKCSMYLDVWLESDEIHHKIFMFFGHNVLTNCSGLMSVRKRNEDLNEIFQ